MANITDLPEKKGEKQQQKIKCVPFVGFLEVLE